MIVQASAPAAIEGSEMSIVGKNIMPAGRPTKYGAGEIAYLLDVKDGGHATITKEYFPKKHKHKEESKLNLGSKISGKTLWGFSSNPIGRGDIKVGGSARTSTHPNQELTIMGDCYMAIVNGWLGNPLPTHPKDSILANQ